MTTTPPEPYEAPCIEAREPLIGALMPPPLSEPPV